MTPKTKKKVVKVSKSICISATRDHCSCYSGDVMYMGVRNVCCFCGKRRRVTRRKKK